MHLSMQEVSAFVIINIHYNAMTDEMKIKLIYKDGIDLSPIHLTHRKRNSHCQLIIMSDPLHNMHTCIFD